MGKEVILIAAVAKNGIIGKGNELPWKLPKDMKFFANTTKNHTVIMGRKTWDSIPSKYKPLPDRRNIVITRQLENIDGAEVFDNFEKAIEASTGQIYICGGGEIYKLALSFATKLILTEVHAEIEGDILFPNFNQKQYKITSKEEHLADEKHAYAFDFVTYEKIN